MEQLVNFFVELINRWIAPTPVFFKTIRKISLIVGFITGIVPLLAMFDIQLSIGVSLVIQKVVSISSFIAAVISQLAQENIDLKKLPFTARLKAKMLK